MRCVALALLPLLLLGGCASRASRENLNRCEWGVAGFQIEERSSSILRGTARVGLFNPTKSPAILDSLRVDVSTPGGPLAFLSHGRTLVLEPGKSDTAVIHLRAEPAQMGMRLMEMIFAMPDSLQVKGVARVPLMGGLFHTDKAFQAKVPAANLMGMMGGALGGQAPVSDTALESDDP